MKNKIATIPESNFIQIHIAKLLARFDIRYNLYETGEEQHDVTFHVFRKDTGKEISGLIHLFVDEDGLNIDGFYPNLKPQNDSHGLSAALAYLLMAFYGANSKNQSITTILLRTEKSAGTKKTGAEDFWLKLQLNLIEQGPVELGSTYYKYTGTFPEKELKQIYELAQASITRIVIEHPLPNL